MSGDFAFFAPITDIAGSRRILLSLGEYETSFGWTWDRVLSFLKLLFETGCADISVGAKWAAGMLSAGIAPPKNRQSFCAGLSLSIRSAGAPR